MEKRLDVYLVENCNITSRTKAQNLIEEGLVLIDGKVVVKVSTKVDEKNRIEIMSHDNYVSRGAYKLLGAINSFGLNFNERVVLDIGASTGGFTQVALNSGAKKVYALDIGKNELDKILVQDERVVNLSNTDIRNLDKEKAEDVNFIIGDLSFISLTKIFPRIKELYGTNIEMMFLYKPQFECGKDIAKKYKGIIKNKEIHKKLLENFEVFIKLLGFSINNITYSPIKGGDGNIEYLIYFSNKDKIKYDIKKVVDSAFNN